MTQEELLKAWQQEIHDQNPNTLVSLELADVMLKALGKVAAQGLESGEIIPLPGIGKLAVSYHAPRKGVNPRTGKAITIPARRKAVLRQSTLLKEKLNG